MAVFRAALAVAIGYLAMAAIVLLGTGGAWAAFGPEGAFREGSIVASNIWSASLCVVGLVAAIGGGRLAAVVGKHPTQLPVKLLAGAVLCVGLALAIAQLGREVQPLPAGKAISDLTFLEAGAVAMPPAWYNFAVPVIGALGALLGGRVLPPSRSEP